MPTFATDTDLLHWEPNIMRDASAVAQTLLTGAGSLSFTVLTLSSGSFIDAHIAPDHVVVFDAPIDGSFPVFSVESPTVINLSVLYDQFEGGLGEGEPWAPNEGEGIAFSIRTFWPQRSIVSELLLQAAGLDVEDASKILNPEALKRPCVLGSLQMIYTALAAAAQEPANLLIRAELYERLYRRALRATTVDLDLDGDGIIDEHRQLNALALHRS